MPAYVHVQSTVDISKSKFIPNHLYLQVNFLVSENLLRDISGLRYPWLKCKRQHFQILFFDIRVVGDIYVRAIKS